MREGKEWDIFLLQIVLLLNGISNYFSFRDEKKRNACLIIQLIQFNSMSIGGINFQ